MQYFKHFHELADFFTDWNIEKGYTYGGSNQESILALVRFEEENFPFPIQHVKTIDARTFIVSSHNKAFYPECGGYSAFGFALEDYNKYGDMLNDVFQMARLEELDAADIKIESIVVFDDI